VASLGDPFDGDDDRHHCRVGVAPTEQPVEFTGGGRFHHPALDPQQLFQASFQLSFARC